MNSRTVATIDLSGLSVVDVEAGKNRLSARRYPGKPWRVFRDDDSEPFGSISAKADAKQVQAVLFRQLLGIK